MGSCGGALNRHHLRRELSPTVAPRELKAACHGGYLLRSDWSLMDRRTIKHTAKHTDSNGSESKPLEVDGARGSMPNTVRYGARTRRDRPPDAGERSPVLMGTSF
jgi:hypothetical protein